MVVVATKEERKLAKKLYPRERIFKTGVGALNVIKSLMGVSKKEKIVNVGYCGSNILPIGTKVKVGKCRLYHPNVEYEEPEYALGGDVSCYTSNDFVLDTDVKEPVVFDMELAYILAMGFKNVTSIKIVSDNLNKKEYEESVKND